MIRCLSNSSWESARFGIRTLYHDSRGGGGSGSDLLERAGCRLLDPWVEVAPGLVLAGVNDRGHHEPADPGVDLLALAKRPSGATILLSHAPERSERAAKAGVGHMLSGHTHGGQIWPFGLLVKTAFPMVAGRYEVAGMSVIVTRGAGTWGPRMRLWRRGEILKVILHPA